MTTTTEATIESLLAEIESLREEKEQAHLVIKLQKREIERLRLRLGSYESSRYKCGTCGSRWDTIQDADACYVRHQERGRP